MDTHKNARLTPKGREEMVRAVVDNGLSKAAAARRFNTTSKTVGKWVERFQRRKVSMVCAIDPPDLFHRQTKPRLPHALSSRLCADSATPASRSQPKSASRPPPSAASCSALRAQQAQRPSNRPNRSDATSASTPGELDPHRHQKARPISMRSATASPATAAAKATAGASAGSTSTSPSTTIRASPSAKIMPRSKRSEAPSPSSRPRRLLQKPRRQGRARHDRQRQLAISPSLSAVPASGSDSSTSAPSPTPQDQRQGRTLHSNCACANGPTPGLSKLTTSDAAPLPIWLHRYNWHRPHAGIDDKTPISRLGLTENNVLRLHN